MGCFASMTPHSVEPTSRTPRCPHPDATQLSEVCTHLWERQTDFSTGVRNYYRCFTGRGLERKLLCKACGEKGGELCSSSVWVCDECLTEVEENGERVGDWGVLGYAIRDVGLKLTATVLPPLPDGARVAKMVSLPLTSGSQWLVLTDRGDLWRVEFTAGSLRRICGVAELGLPIDQELSLVASRTGEFAVVALSRGQTGLVIETESGRVLMSLDRHNYHNEQCLFSAAFFEHEGRTLLVHATDWNRLDISEPRSGRLLTSRGPTSYTDDKQRPENYLDYFHCGLALSPNDEWIAGNGWVWHPVGVVRTWNLRDWLTKNVWESENGPSCRQDIGRSYYWDGPLCWVSDGQLAAWGVGADDYSLLPAVRLVDVINGEERTPLVGPLGPTKAATTSESAAANGKLAKNGVLEFDRYLLAWSPSAGFTAWDLADGARVFEDSGFFPLAYNRATQEFFTQDTAGICRLSKLIGER